MKKFFLSISVIAAFIVYSFIRQNSAEARTPQLPSQGIPTGTPEVTPEPTAEPTAGGSVPLNPTSVPAAAPTASAPRGQYKDGTYTGGVFDAFYGNIQVQAIVSGGRLTDVQFLQYPNDRRTSIEINSQAMPMLRQEAIQAQSANVDIISGASDSSSAFIQSLQSALDKAKV